MNDWTNPLGLHDGPDKVCDTRNRHEVCFDGEEMSDLVDGEPDCRKTAEPKEEETQIVPGVRS